MGEFIVEMVEIRAHLIGAIGVRQRSDEVVQRRVQTSLHLQRVTAEHTNFVKAERQIISPRRHRKDKAQFSLRIGDIADV